MLNIDTLIDMITAKIDVEKLSCNDIANGCVNESNDQLYWLSMAGAVDIVRQKVNWKSNHSVQGLIILLGTLTKDVDAYLEDANYARDNDEDDNYARGRAAGYLAGRDIILGVLESGGVIQDRYSLEYV